MSIFDQKFKKSYYTLFIKTVKQRCFEAFQLLFRAVKFLSKKKKI